MSNTEIKKAQSKHLEIHDEVSRLESQVDRLQDLFKKIVGEPQEGEAKCDETAPTLCDILDRTPKEIRLQSDRVRDLAVKIEEALY